MSKVSFQQIHASARELMIAAVGSGRPIRIVHPTDVCTTKSNWWVGWCGPAPIVTAVTHDGITFTHQPGTTVVWKNGDLVKEITVCPMEQDQVLDALVLSLHGSDIGTDTTDKEQTAP